LENLQIRSDSVKYLIVQAGGQGTRMGQFTANKPKCLVPVNGITLIENTLKTFADCTVIIIGDHLYETLEKYLATFCSHYNYQLIRTGEKGTAAGLSQAAELIPADEPFALTWSDLFFEQPPEYTLCTDVLIGLTDEFACRWSYRHNQLVNESSNTNGVAGFYVFAHKQLLANLTSDQSLVRGFLQNFTGEIHTFKIRNCFEVGDVATYQSTIKNHRFFNRVTMDTDTVTKTCCVSEFNQLIEDEITWYQHVQPLITNVPKLISTQPLILQRIQGKHAFDISHNKSQIIDNYCAALNTLHAIESRPSSHTDCDQVYNQKPQRRLAQAKAVIPFADQLDIKINGKWCRNPLTEWPQLQHSPAHFTLIHGDPTFSNTLIDHNHTVWFIDPRGRFGSSRLYGDPAYDWAKLYYSAVGNYDSINHKNFVVKLYDNAVDLEIKSLGYEQCGDQIVCASALSKSVINQLHAGIWLSLSGYVTEDVDAMMFAFYQGVYVWNHI